MATDFIGDALSAGWDQAGANIGGAAQAGGGGLGALGLNPWTIGIAIGTQWFQNRQADRAERKRLREASEAASKDPRQIDAGAVIGKYYGYTKFPPLFFYGDRNRGIPLIPANTIGTMTPSHVGRQLRLGRGQAVPPGAVRSQRR